MKTTQYNPSPLEVELANAFASLDSEISKHLKNNEIIKIENNIEADNPSVIFHLLDKDGDPHEVVIKIIQKPDKF